MIKLSKAPQGEPCVIVSIEEGEMGTRLLEMGIIPSAKIEVLFSAPGGCPIAVSIHQEYVLGIRLEEANLVTVCLTKH